jgi:hypothetical protein
MNHALLLGSAAGFLGCSLGGSSSESSSDDEGGAVFFFFVGLLPRSSEAVARYRCLVACCRFVLCSLFAAALLLPEPAYATAATLFSRALDPPVRADSAATALFARLLHPPVRELADSAPTVTTVTALFAAALVLPAVHAEATATALFTRALDPPVRTDVTATASFASALDLPVCGQMTLPPHSLHVRFSFPCGQMALPPLSLHRPSASRAGRWHCQSNTAVFALALLPLGPCSLPAIPVAGGRRVIGGRRAAGGRRDAGGSHGAGRVCQWPPQRRRPEPRHGGRLGIRLCGPTHSAQRKQASFWTDGVHSSHK